MPMTSPSYSSFLRCAILPLLFLLLGAGAIADVPRLEIDVGDDAQLLPYAAEVLWERSFENQKVPAHHPVRVLWPMGDSADRAGVLFCYNMPTYLLEPSMIIVQRWPGFKIVDENPVKLCLSDVSVLPVPDSVPLTVIGTGMRNDSGFFFSYQPIGEVYREYFLVAGHNRGGTGEWNGRLPIVLNSDIDQDGVVDPLVFVSAGRDGLPRELIRIAPLSGGVEWRLHVTSLVQTIQNGLSAAQEPYVTFVTSCPGQGYADSLFDDRYSYFVTITPEGQVVTQLIVGTYPESAEIMYDSTADLFYLYHTIMPTADSLIGETTTPIPRLSVIASSGEVLQTIQLTEKCKPMMLHDYRPGGGRELYTLSVTGVIRIYDSSLNLLAESDQSTLGGFLGLGPPLPGHPKTFALRDSRKFVALFNESFEKLAILPDLTYYEVMSSFESEDSTVIAVSLPADNIRILRLRPRRFMELVSVLFNRYRNYIMAVLFSLLVGLVIVNYYRVRTRKNLLIISDQKAEIERTHKALQEAQEKIIQAEKYLQAQDIAGGFAHEIRNALLPAQIVHQRLRNRHGDDAETINRAEHAVRRALDLIDHIARYTKLETVERAEPLVLGAVLQSVLADLRLRMEEEGITVIVEGQEPLQVHADLEHVRILFSNLLTNSCDAVATQAVREITVQLTREASQALVAVRDSGGGIDPAILPRMFSPFVSSKPRDGHGLGLSLVHRIVSLYEGTVWAENLTAGGAKVSFTLPLDA